MRLRRDLEVVYPGQSSIEGNLNSINQIRLVACREVRMKVAGDP